MENKEHTSRLDAIVTLFGMNRIQAKAYSMYSKKPELLSVEELIAIAKDLQNELTEQKTGLIIGTIVGTIGAYTTMSIL